MATAAKEFKPSLKDGRVGSQLVAWFAENHGTVATDAVALDGGNHLQMDYSITFEHGITQAYRVTFAGGLKVTHVTPLN